MQEKMEEKKSKAGKILAILVAAAAVIALVAVLARPSERKGSPLFEKEAQVIENETCGFTFTLPAGYTRYVLRDADSTGRSIATYYALGRDNDISVQCYPVFFNESTDVDNSDLEFFKGLDDLYYRGARWVEPAVFDLGSVKAVRCIGPHPSLENGVNVSYDIRNGKSLISLNVIYYTDKPARRPDWDKVRQANALASGIELH